MYINAIEAKRMVTEDKELNAKFRELIRGIAQLYAFQARTIEYSLVRFPGANQRVLDVTGTHCHPARNGGTGADPPDRSGRKTEP